MFFCCLNRRVGIEGSAIGSCGEKTKGWDGGVWAKKTVSDKHKGSRGIEAWADQCEGILHLLVSISRRHLHHCCYYTFCKLPTRKNTVKG